MKSRKYKSLEENIMPQKFKDPRAAKVKGLSAYGSGSVHHHPPSRHYPPNLKKELDDVYMQAIANYYGYNLD
jgi:hypothetical protein